MSAAPEPHAAAIRAIGQEIVDAVAIPKDHWEIAAQLEIRGIRVIDARTDYGCEDIFDLARRIDALYRSGEIRTKSPPRPIEEPSSLFLRFLRHYADGIFLSLPMAIQIAAMLAFGYTLWGAAELDGRTATAISLGFFTSFIVAGGFCQALVRRGLFYRYQEEDHLAFTTVLQIFVLGLAGTLVVTLLGAVANLLYGVLPWDMAGIAGLYYVSLSVLWLGLAVVYLAQKRILFVVLVTGGLAVVLLLALRAGWSAVPANLAGILLLDAASLAIGFGVLAHRARAKGRTQLVTPPRLAVLVFAVAAYFLYGSCYYAFLFADRLIAWSSGAGRGGYLPFVIWFDSRYETGMDAALVVVVLLMGFVEHVAQRFSEEVVPAQQRVVSTELPEFNRRSTRFYRGQVLFVSLAAVAAVFLTWALILWLRGHVTSVYLAGLFDPVAMRVFWVAAVGYAFFSLGLMNVLVLLSLSRIGRALRVMAIGLAVNVSFGFVLSRAVDSTWAAGGLLAGSIVFAVLSVLETDAVFRRIDFFFYAAY